MESGTNSNHKIKNIQAMRAIAAIMVLLAHASVNNILEPFGYIGFVGVDIFFIISGIVLTITTYNHMGYPPHIKKFIRKRFIRIYSNYWLCLIIIGVLFWLGLAEISDSANIIPSIFLLPQRGINNIIPVAWTLCYELYFYFIFMFAIVLPRRFFIHFLSIWFLIIAISATLITRDKNTSFGLLFFLSPFNLEFIIGCVIGLLIKKNASLYPKTLLIIGVFILISTAYITSADILKGHDKTLFRVIFYGSSCGLIIYGLAICELKNLFTLPNFLSKLGDSSYSIYIMHTTIFTLLSAHILPIITPLFAPLADITPAHGVIMVLCSIIYGALHYKYMEKPILKCLNKGRVLRKAKQL